MSVIKILADGLRRQSINENWDKKEMVVLCFPSEAKRAKELGFISPSSYVERPRIMNWYNFTDKGLEEAKKLRKSKLKDIAAGKAEEVEYWWNF